MFYHLENSQRVYTLREEDASNAHPAKFSLEDRFSRERIAIKRRFNIPPFNGLEQGNSHPPTQSEEIPLECRNKRA